jgi:hypothetical protein
MWCTSQGRILKMLSFKTREKQFLWQICKSHMIRNFDILIVISAICNLKSDLIKKVMIN